MSPSAIELLLLSLLAAPADRTVAVDPGSRRCLACHSLVVAEHLHDWDRSVHARAGVTCESCHVPRPTGPRAAPGTKGWPTAATTCGSCHIAIETAFRTSMHAAQAKGPMPSPTCADCHTRAGGNVLAPERFAERCGRCHAEKTSKGDLEISRRAIAVLDLLRRVTLARALVGQEIDAQRHDGTLKHATDQSFEDLRAAIDDLSVEWHRFDFEAVEDRCRRVLAKLEDLHRQLLEKP